MDAANFELQIAGLGKIDALELRRELPDTAPLKVEAVDEESGVYHEPGTVLILIAAGTIALPVVLLALARRRQGFDLEEETRKKPDGSETTTRRIRVRESSISPETVAKLRVLLPSGVVQKLVDLYAGKPE